MTREGPTLVVLAAGMGRRFGGLKQVESLGPSGERLLDYSVHDAIAAGFTRAVFVIRPGMREDFERDVTARFADRVDVACVEQDVDTLPAGRRPPDGRERPWGTGHAVWCARRAVRRPFAVINSDDFYGAAAMGTLGEFLGDADPAGTDWATVAWPLERTLSDGGRVSRGLCVTSGGTLSGLTEVHGLHREGGGAIVDEAGTAHGPQSPVSMNCWAFTPALFPLLEEDLCRFLREEVRGDAALEAEHGLPESVARMCAAGDASVRVITTDSPWLGVTHADDADTVRARLAAMVEAGEYPADLWA